MIIKKLIEKVEGEANLNFEFKDGKINSVDINFNIYRGIEEILRGKAPRDALVINPRVCGICNHAHLIATVKALEDGLERSGIEFIISKKAKDIREFTLACELIQNHIKWLYLTIYPNLNKILKLKIDENYALKASYIANIITKALAIFAGQWPHSSYAVIGGVTCDPTYLDVIQAQNYMEDAIRFFEKVVIGISLDEYLSIKSVSNLNILSGDFAKLLYLLGENGFAKRGKSFDRFISFTNSKISKRAKSIATTISKVDFKYIKEYSQDDSFAKGVKYKDKFFETGPLARAIINKEPIIKSLHKKYKDSTLTRVYARVHEVALLLKYAKDLLINLDITQPSCTLNSKIEINNIKGIASVEAARGSLIHKVNIEDGLIKEYSIITPTQWNLSNNGVATHAMLGVESQEIASFIFRTFDVCSVCTTH